MSVRHATGAFRAALGYNLYDVGGVTNATTWGGWTRGASQIDLVTDIAPQPGSNWQILAFSVCAKLTTIESNAFVETQKYWGRFGRILAGIPSAEQRPTIRNAAGQFYTQPVLPLPSDVSQIADLWNPEVDPMPPSVGTIYLPVSAALTLPQPIEVIPDIGILIGIWMLPSLLASTPSFAACREPQISSAIYTVTYEDGV